MQKQKKKNHHFDNLHVIPKTITILPMHEKFIKEQSLSLTHFVRKKLFEEMKARGINTTKLIKEELLF